MTKLKYYQICILNKGFLNFILNHLFLNVTLGLGEEKP